MQPDITQSPEFQAANAEVATIEQAAAQFVVSNAAQYAVAGDELKRIKGAAKKLEELRTSITKPMDAAKKAVMDLFRTPEQRLADAEKKIKGAMLTYSAAEETRRREEQRKLDEKARKERDALAKKAAEAAAKGDESKAAALQERAATVVAPVVAAPAKVAGIQTREVWLFEVTDPALVPREYCSVDEKKIRAVVGGLKGETRIPGVRVYSEQQMAARSA